MSKQQWNVGILLYDEVDVLDYAGPFEAFSLTVYEDKQVETLLTKGLNNEERPFIVKMISQDGEMICSHNGLKIQPDFSFDNLGGKFDILIVPGGPLRAVKKITENREVINWIEEFYKAGGLIASVCSGAILLAEAGILSGKRATTHHLAIDYMKAAYPDIEVLSNVRFVDQGDILTSAGVSAGIDLTLHIIDQLMGEETAKRTAATEEYPYDWKSQGVNI